MQEQEKEINLVFEPEENWILLRQGRRGRKSLTHKFVSSFDGFTFSTKIQGCESRIYNNIEFCQKSRTTMSNFRADKLELLGFAPVFSTVFFVAFSTNQKTKTCCSLYWFWYLFQTQQVAIAKQQQQAQWEQLKQIQLLAPSRL